MGPAWTTQDHHYQNYYSNNKLVTSSPEKFGTMGVTTGKKMTMISALLGEKLAHLRADLQLGLYRLAHPVHPQIRRIAAQESNIAQKSVATGMVMHSFIPFFLSHMSVLIPFRRHTPLYNMYIGCRVS